MCNRIQPSSFMLRFQHITHANNHYLTLDMEEVVENNTDRPQTVTDSINQQRGLGYTAHPEERLSLFVNEGVFYDWKD